MKTRIKILFTALLSAALCFSLLVGCADSAVETSGSASEEVSTSEASETSSVQESSAQEIEWQRMFCALNSNSPFYILFPKGVRPYDCCTGASSTKLLEHEVVLLVDYGDPDFSADYGEDPFSAKSLEEIVPSFSYTFSQILRSSDAFFADTTESEPYFEINHTELLTVDAVSATYEVCRSEGTYYYTEADIDGDVVALNFVTYATFLSDGMTPVFCAAVDVSETQCEAQACEDYCLEMIQGLEEVSPDFFGY